jgi:transcriptional regulator with XRE-family HTH domain
MTETKSHIGKKISRIRDLRGVKQEELAIRLGISQQAVSKIEQSEDVDGDTLGKIADILGVLPDAIRNFSDEAALNYFNNFNDNSTGAFNNFNCTFNPIDKVVELYERLLEAEREKNELLKASNQTIK